MYIYSIYIYIYICYSLQGLLKGLGVGPLRRAGRPASRRCTIIRVIIIIIIIIILIILIIIIIIIIVIIIISINIIIKEPVHIITFVILRTYARSTY